ncbi:MAG: LysR family transcriptional regulator, partial [Pseudomonadota bacterium]
MQTRALATLIAIADSGSFVRAAETRNMTLSAVSSQMKSLESTLDATLFDRSFRPPRLTAIGQSVVTHARQVLAAEEMLVQACGRRDRLQGPVRAGFVLSAGVRVMPAFLERAQAPDTALEITVSSGLSRDLLRDVAEGRLDLAVLTLDEAPSADLYHVE